jgi:hypothetical protein
METMLNELFKVKVSVTGSMLEGLLITAFEGGSNYWLSLGDTSHVPRKKGSSTAEDIHAFVCGGGENAVQVFDREVIGEVVGDILGEVIDEDDEDALLGVLSLANYERGTQLLINDYPERWARVVEEAYDAEDADVWLQLVVMGELVFG